MMPSFQEENGILRITLAISFLSPTNKVAMTQPQDRFGMGINLGGPGSFQPGQSIDFWQLLVESHRLSHFLDMIHLRY